jgi:hypothetical protein
MHSLIGHALVVPVLAVSGCGDASSGKPTAASPTPTALAKAAEPPPAELLGTYATALRSADVPADAPPELAGQHAWLVKISPDGGVDGGPSLAIVRPPSDTLEIAKLSVSGDTLTLSDEECAPSEPSGKYTFVTSSYRWKLGGTTLRLTAVKKGCPDEVAETILTSRPWKKRA